MADIVLKDKRGNTITYPGVETIEIPTESGEMQLFSAGAGGGSGLENWNIFLKVWTAPTPTSADLSYVTVATPEEIAASGITLYPLGATTGQLRTVLAMVRSTNSAMYSSVSGSTGGLLLTNAQITYAYSSNTNTNGVVAYQASSTTNTATTVGSDKSSKWQMYNGGVKLDNAEGLVAYSSTNMTFVPRGTYIVILLQHKTNTISETPTS